MSLTRRVLAGSALVLSLPSWAAESAEDHYTRDWYVTEIIVFQRPTVMEYNTAEQLIDATPEAYPLNMRAFYVEERARESDLDEDASEADPEERAPEAEPEEGAPEADPEEGAPEAATAPAPFDPDYNLYPEALASLLPEFTTTERPETFEPPAPKELTEAPVDALQPHTQFDLGTEPAMQADTGIEPETQMQAESEAQIDPDVASEPQIHLEGEAADLADTAEHDQQQEPVPLPVPAINPTLFPNPLMRFLNALADYEATLKQSSFRWLQPDTLQLSDASRALTRRLGAQVILHGRWLQPVPARESPEPLYIQAGALPDGERQLRGTMSLTLGRYLHFHARLLYREPGFGLAPVFAPQSAQSAAPTHAKVPVQEVDGFMVLDESRRMRSEEIHYLDHPKFGVIVRIDPVLVPEAVQLGFEALQEDVE